MPNDLAAAETRILANRHAILIEIGDDGDLGSRGEQTAAGFKTAFLEVFVRTAFLRRAEEIGRCSSELSSNS